MEQQIRQQLMDLTGRYGLDAKFVERILAGMEKPIVNLKAEPVAQNETVISIASIMEKGILTVASQTKDAVEAMIAEKNLEEIKADNVLFSKFNSLIKDFRALEKCFWSSVKTRLEEEGVTGAGIIDIRNDFQIVILPIADLLNTFGSGAVIVRVSTNRNNTPAEILEACPCPVCEEKRARRRNEGDK